MGDASEAQVSLHKLFTVWIPESGPDPETCHIECGSGKEGLVRTRPRIEEMKQHTKVYC